MSNSNIIADPSVPEAVNPSDICVGAPVRLQRNNRSAGKGRRRRAVAEQRRAEQDLWSHLVHNTEEDIYVAPPTPPISRRQLRRAARRSSHEEWEDAYDDHLDVALALSLSLLETPNSASRHDEQTGNFTTLSGHQHLDMSYENLVMLENVKCTAPAALIRSLSGHIFKKDSGVSTSLSAAEICTICQVEYKDGDSCIQLPCLHTFHDVCGSEWFMNHSKLCPVCKHDITEKV